MENENPTEELSEVERSQVTQDRQSQPRPGRDGRSGAKTPGKPASARQVPPNADTTAEGKDRTSPVDPLPPLAARPILPGPVPRSSQPPDRGPLPTSALSSQGKGKPNWTAPSHGDQGRARRGRSNQLQGELQRRIWATLKDSPRKALLVSAVAAVVLAAAGAFLVLRGPTYWTSRTVMVIDDPYGLAAAGDPSQLLKLDQLRYKYTALAGTDLMAKPVATKLHLSASQVLANTAAFPSPATLLIDVYGRWSNPTEARRLSAALAAEIHSYVISENTTFGIPPTDQFSIRVADPASPATESGPSKGEAAGVAAAMALAGFALAYAAAQLIGHRGLVT